MMQSTTTADRIPAWLLRLYRATGVVLALVGIAAAVTIMMPWVEESGVVSHGPIATFAVFLAAMIAGSLLLGRGRSFRRRHAVPPEEGRSRARKAVVAGMLAGLAALLERWLISYNLESIDDLGLTPGAGVEVANAVVVALFVCAGVALVFGVIGLFVPPVDAAGVEPIGFDAPAPAAVPTVGWSPTHRVPDDGMPAFAGPGAGVPTVMLDPRLPVLVTGCRGEHASVRTENGWQGWVRADDLVPLGVETTPPIPPMPVG
jgi:hypothetical protein